MSSTQQVRFQLRRGDQAYWDANSGYVLLNGEPGYNTSTNQIKMGNGSAMWGVLPYINLPGPVGTYTTLSSIVNVPGTVTITPGGNVFTLSQGLTQALAVGQAVRFTGTVAMPLVKNTSYYVLESKNLGERTILVSKTFNGANIVLKTTLQTRNGPFFTLTGLDTNQITAIGQAIYFTDTATPSFSSLSGGLSIDTVYYVAQVVANNVVTLSVNSTLTPVLYQ